MSVGCSSFPSVGCVHVQSITGGFQHPCSQNQEPLQRKGPEMSPTARTGESVPSNSCCGISFSFPAKIHYPSLEIQASSWPCYALQYKSNTRKIVCVLGSLESWSCHIPQHSKERGFGVPLILHAKGLQCLADLLSPAKFHHGQQQGRVGEHISQRAAPAIPGWGQLKLLLYSVHSVSQSLMTLCSVLLSNCFWRPFAVLPRVKICIFLVPVVLLSWKCNTGVSRPGWHLMYTSVWIK